MVRLKKVKKTDNYIEAYYIPENTSEQGYIKLDAHTGKDLEVRKTPSDDSLNWYYRYARRYLKQVLEGTAKLEEERLVMWY